MISNTKLITATFTPGTSYSVGNCFGGILSAQTGTNGSSIVKLKRIMVVGSAGTLTAVSNLGIHFFNTSSTSTTFTDAASPTWNSADNSKLQYSAVLSGNLSAANGSLGATVYEAANTTATGISSIVIPLAVQTDSSGNINIVLIAGGTWTLVTPAVFTVTLEIEF